MKKLKKISSACCVMVLAAALLFQNTATYCSAAVNSSAGSSTEIPEGYTPIYTIADLAGINSDTSGNYILMNDIDMTEETSPGALGIQDTDGLRLMSFQEYLMEMDTELLECTYMGKLRTM